MLVQRGCDLAAIQGQRREAGRVAAKGARLIDGSARDDHPMPCSDQMPRDASAKAAISAKEQYTDHRIRRACSAVGIQQVEPCPNSW